MTDASDGPFTLAFVGYATPEASERARAYEDAVLPLLADHGAELVYRGRRTAGQDASLPLEVQLIRFPHRDALASYLADDRRAALVAQFGDVFSTTHVVEMDTLSAPGLPSVRRGVTTAEEVRALDDEP